MNATESKPTTTRKSRTKPARSLRVLSRDRDGYVSALEIKVGDGVTIYAVDATPEGDGMAYRLTKDDGEVYVASISEAMGNHCTCPAGKFGKPCKHLAGLVCVAMRDAQRPLCHDPLDCHDE